MLIDQYLRKKFTKTRKAGDSKTKSVVKAISWRTLGTLDTILISYLITGEAKMAFSIGSLEVFSKIALYYVHERFWERLTVKKDSNELERTNTLVT